MKLQLFMSELLRYAEIQRTTCKVNIDPHFTTFNVILNDTPHASPIYFHLKGMLYLRCGDAFAPCIMFCLYLHASLIIPIILHYSNVLIQESLKVRDFQRILLSIHRKLFHHKLKLLQKVILRIDLLISSCPEVVVKLEYVFRECFRDLLTLLDSICVFVTELLVFTLESLILTGNLSCLCQLIIQLSDLLFKSISPHVMNIVCFYAETVSL